MALALKALSYCSICRGNWYRQIIQVDISHFCCSPIYPSSHLCVIVSYGPYLIDREIVYSRNSETLHFDSQYFLFVQDDKSKKRISLIHDSQDNDK